LPGVNDEFQPTSETTISLTCLVVAVGPAAGVALVPALTAVRSSGAVPDAPATSSTVNASAALALNVTVTLVTLFAATEYQISASFEVASVTLAALVQVFPAESVTFPTVTNFPVVLRSRTVATSMSPAVDAELVVALSDVVAEVLPAPKERAMPTVALAGALPTVATAPPAQSTATTKSAAPRTALPMLRRMRTRNRRRQPEALRVQPPTRYLPC
jgi:hypothetical protein